MSIFSGKVKGDLVISVTRLQDGSCKEGRATIDFDSINSPAEMEAEYHDALHRAVADITNEIMPEVI